MKKVMITGIGMLTAVGNGREASWENIKAGKPGIGKITKFDASRCTCQVAADEGGCFRFSRQTRRRGPRFRPERLYGF